MNRPRKHLLPIVIQRQSAILLCLAAFTISQSGCQSFIFGRRPDESKISVRKTNDRSWFNWFRSSRDGASLESEYADFESAPSSLAARPATNRKANSNRESAGSLSADGPTSNRLTDSPTDAISATATGLRREFPEEDSAPEIKGLSSADNDLLARQMEAIQQRNLLESAPERVSGASLNAEKAADPNTNTTLAKLIPTSTPDSNNVRSGDSGSGDSESGDSGSTTQASIQSVSTAAGQTDSSVAQASATSPVLTNDANANVSNAVALGKASESAASAPADAGAGTRFRMSDEQPTPAPQPPQLVAVNVPQPTTPLAPTPVTPATAVAPIDSAPVASNTIIPSDNKSWGEHLRQAVVTLENDIKAMGSNVPEEVKFHHEAALRLLYLSENRLDDSMKPIEVLQPHEQDYFRHQFQALHAAMDPAATPVRSRRWSLAMHSQRQASNHLAAVSNLEIRNLAFCSAVESYGLVTKFPSYQFVSEQELLLYCELENLAAQQIKDGFETELQGTYEIFNSAGVRIADQILPPDKHVCRNFRRDYFIAYRVYLPANLPDGKYQLRLTIEDMKGRKFGQASSDFQIKAN